MEADVRTASCDVLLPGAAIEVGEKVAEAPLGRPETERATRALKPPEAAAVTVVDAVPPGAVEIAGGATVRERSGPTTTSERAPVRVRPPPLPETTSG